VRGLCGFGARIFAAPDEPHELHEAGLLPKLNRRNRTRFGSMLMPVCSCLYPMCRRPVYRVSLVSIGACLISPHRTAENLAFATTLPCHGRAGRNRFFRLSRVIVWHGMALVGGGDDSGIRLHDEDLREIDPQPPKLGGSGRRVAGREWSRSAKPSCDRSRVREDAKRPKRVASFARSRIAAGSPLSIPQASQLRRSRIRPHDPTAIQPGFFTTRRCRRRVFVTRREG
jgi:hypothetical protein